MKSLLVKELKFGFVIIGSVILTLLLLTLPIFYSFYISNYYYLYFYLLSIPITIFFVKTLLQFKIK